MSEGHSPQTGFKIASNGVSTRANLDDDGNVQVVVMSGGGGGGGGACTIADAADTVEGALADAAIVTDAAGTVSGKLRGLVKIFADIWDSTNNFFRVGPKIGTTTGTIAAAPDTVKAVLNGKYASASFQLLATGGPTGTLTVEVSVDSEVTYFAAECWNPQASYTGPIIATNNIDVSVTSSGLWTVPLPPGATHLKFRGNGWGSGSWALIVNASTAPAMDRRQMGQPIISAPSNGGGTGQQMLVNRGGAATYLIDSASGSVVTVNGSALADTFANPANVLEVQTFPSNYNGATWDRQRGDTTNGLDVDVTRSALPTGAATLAAQTQPGVDIGDVTINNAAGASAVNIQDGGNVITVDGTVTATQGNAGTNAQAWWTRIGDATTGPVVVKGASTPPAAADKALVVSLSPNSATPDPTPIQDSLFWDTTTAGGTSQTFNVAGYATFTFFMGATSATGGVITITGSQTGSAVTLPIYEITSTGPVARTSLDISVLGTAERMYMIPILGVEHVIFTLTSVITGGGAFVVVSTEANIQVWPEPLSSQGFKGTLAGSWWQQISDGTTGPVAVKAASTAAIATDKALVVAVSPNTSVAVTNANLDVALSTRLKAADTLAAVTTVGTIANPVTVAQPTGTNLHVVVDSMPAVSSSTSADVLAADGDAGYTVGDLAKNLTQTDDGRLRAIVAGLVSDTVQSYQDGVRATLSLTAEGRLRVATASESYNFTPWGSPESWGSDDSYINGSHPLSAW